MNIQKEHSKVCRVCNELKPLSEYHKHKTSKDGLRHDCSICRNKNGRIYTKKNKEWLREYSRQRNIFCRDKINEYRKKCYKNPKVKILSSCRSRLRFYLKSPKNTNKYIDMLGCTIGEFRKHIESQFIDGMSWENHGDWHIDHIIPCKSFDLTDEIQKNNCFNYKNLRPLWAYENIIKNSNK